MITIRELRGLKGSEKYFWSGKVTVVVGIKAQSAIEMIKPSLAFI